MRANEFITEDEASPSHSAANLLSVLDTLSNRLSDEREEPKIRLDALINMVRATPGSEMFNVDSLVSAYEKNSAVKNMITGVKDDGTGVKHVFIRPAIGDIRTSDINIGNELDSDPSGDDLESGPEITVSKMAKRAAKKRN